jgi:hypothetical protein
MNYSKKEEGYALITVLLIITVFMILFLSFAGQSINNTKQNQVIEKDSQSIALSEMGVIYFETLARNVYISNSDTIQNEVKNLRANDVQTGTVKANDIYIQDAINSMVDKLKILKPMTLQIDDNPTASFRIDPKEGETNIVQTINNTIKIDFISTGIENGEEKKIDGTLTMDFSGFLTSDDNSGGGGGSNSPILTGNNISDPGNLPACSDSNKKVDFTNTTCQISGSETYSNNDQLTFNNSTFKVTGALSVPNMNNDISSSTLFIQGSMSGENMNSLNQINLHVNGSASFGNFNGNGLNGSTIEIGGSSTMGNMNLSGSTLYIGGTANIGQINSITDSTIYINTKINSDTTIQGVNFGNNSTICVNGPLTIGNINNNSNGSSNIYAKSSDNPKVITDSAAFMNKCNKSSSTISWGTPTISANFDYSY